MVKLDYITVPLLKWYDENSRILPWRKNKEAYRIWVSEIMLQQTRVEAVKPYFERFLTQLPGVAELALAEEDKLLKLWEGLGYYNRVRNMQKAARMIMQEYEGTIPADYETLLKLPGIGAYTAGAIASISYNIPVPAVDGNVLRVLTRLTADDSDILKQKTKKHYEQLLADIIPIESAGKFNQALMELGAIVCIPNGTPKCEACPWHDFCQARKEGLTDSIPFKTAKKPRRIEKRTILIIRKGNTVALMKRPKEGLLAGLYEFPGLDGHLSEEEVLSYLNLKGIEPIHIEPLVHAKHIFSHVEWDMIGYAVKAGEFISDNKTKESDGLEEFYLFIEPEEIQNNYPIPSAFKAYITYANIKL